MLFLFLLDAVKVEVSGFNTIAVLVKILLRPFAYIQ